MNKELNCELNEGVEGIMEECEVTEILGKRSFKKPLIMLGVGVVTAGAIVAVRHFSKKKIEDLMIKKLRKKGYIIFDVVDPTDEVEEDFGSDTED